MDGPGAGGVGADVASQLGSQIGYGSKHAAGADLALDFGEPQLDLIEPGGVGGREVESDAGILLEELPYQPRFVGGEIVEDDVNRLRGRSHLLKRRRLSMIPHLEE